MEDTFRQPLFLLLVSALVVLSMFIKAGAQRYLRIPPVVGYILLGLIVRAVNQPLALIAGPGIEILEFLSEMGVAALLFHVGLKSKIADLLRELPGAISVWIFDVLGSAVLAFVVARYLLQLPLISSLFVSAALSATSVGVSVLVWDEADRLRSRLGQLLVDVAELDDLSAIVLMLLVLAAAPVLRGSGADSLVLALSQATFVLLGKLVVFALGCWVFARFIEQRFTDWIDRSERAPDRILSIVGVGFAIAALAGAMGFSVAVGALFAGLMFSRDPKAVREEASFGPIYALFSPFFFINVGFSLDPTVMLRSLGWGGLLFIPAVVGKFVGAGLPVARRFGLRAGCLMGVSMVPRAEIALLVAHLGQKLGPWAVSDRLYGALVVTSGLSVILSPLVLQRLFVRWPQLEG